MAGVLLLMASVWIVFEGLNRTVFDYRDGRAPYGCMSNVPKGVLAETDAFMARFAGLEYAEPWRAGLSGAGDARVYSLAFRDKNGHSEVDVTMKPLRVRRFVLPTPLQREYLSETRSRYGKSIVPAEAEVFDAVKPLLEYLSLPADPGLYRIDMVDSHGMIKHRGEDTLDCVWFVRWAEGVEDPGGHVMVSKYNMEFSLYSLKLMELYCRPDSPGAAPAKNVVG